jgi:hypothetical protein
MNNKVTRVSPSKLDFGEQVALTYFEYMSYFA